MHRPTTVSSVNRFTELVGVRLPIQLAGMSGAATAELAAAVCNAGALGMIGVGRQPIELVERYLDAMAALTTKPFGITCIAHLVRPDVEALIADQVQIMEFFYDWPTATRVRSDTIVGWQVGSLDEALAAADAGCSYVIVQGVEAGGHVRGQNSLASLLTAVREAIDLPIVAAGGIGTADDVRRVMAMGADAVRVGTRFIATVESNAHPQYIDALVASAAGDTELTEAFGVGWPNAPHRVLRSALAAAESASDVVATMESNGTPVPVPRWGVSLPTRETAGNIAAMALYAGTSVEAIQNVTTAADVVAELAAGLTETFRS
jgi:NAD(P)H-dependent flavin oxidoreductase YrpB (nitropropane dioxygenase family)